MAGLRPLWDQSLSRLVNFDNCDSLSEVLFDEKIPNNGPKDENEPTARQPTCDQANEFQTSSDPTARVATLQRRNQQLQKALALASVHHAKEVAAMRREIEKLRQEVELLRQGSGNAAY